MPGLREEITKTYLRLRGRGGVRSQTADAETVVKPDGREGLQLGHYRVLRRLGAGGMGHVYLALDTHLGRHVALKFLPPDLVSDAEMLLRLEGEARAASALNHPNILTIYEIGRLGSDVCIVSEFVDGATLRHALVRGLITVDSAIDIACQVASALVAAHAAGVVHRDLKPANIMIRDDGFVKVIDFGLAKHSTSARGESTRTLTQPGSVVGTVDYMSPEQAKGDPVDHRTDLWSLGVVLYEMVANRLPFEGATDSHVIVAILDQPTSPLPGGKASPAGLARIVERALAKTPDKRYGDAREMLDDLQALSPAPRRASAIRLPASVPGPGRKEVLSVLAILLAVAAAGAIWRWQTRAPDWFQIASVRQLTDTGRASLPVISPDGRYLAFVNGDPGNQETLMLRQVDTPVEQVKIPPRKISYQGLTFSPDGETLYEVEKDDALVGRLYAVPLLGSRPAVPVLVDIDGPVSFSPDGRQFCFVRRATGSSYLELANRDGSSRRQLLTLKGSTIFNYADWSPKGDRIAIFINDSPGASRGMMLDTVDLQGHESRRPVPDWRVVGQPRWTRDARGLIVTVATQTEADNQSQLREIDQRTGEIRALTRDLACYKSASLTRNNDPLAALKVESRASLWASADNDLTIGQNLNADTEEHPTLAWADAKRLVSISKRSGYPNLWLWELPGPTRMSFTDEPFVEQGAAPVPGTRSVVFTSNRSGQFHLWLFHPDTNNFVQLTTGPDYDEAPSVSSDGQWVLYTSWTGNQPHLRRISLNGSGNKLVTPFAAKNGVISPDGTRILCVVLGPSGLGQLAVLPVGQPSRYERLPGAQAPAVWSPDGRSLTVTKTDKGVSNVWTYPLDGGTEKRLTQFDEKMITALAWSSDGRRLACLRISQGADAVLFRSVR